MRGYLVVKRRRSKLAIFIGQHAWRESTTKCYNGSPWGKNTDSLPKLLRYSDVSLVDPAFYRDIVSTCAKASLAPAFNIMEMATLQKRYSEHWTLCSCWLSGQETGSS